MVGAAAMGSRANVPALLRTGAWFTDATPILITKDCTADVSAPPLAVPPLSWSATLTVAVPLALAAGVNESVPLAAIVGCTLKMPLLLFVTLKLSVWLASLAGPALSAVAQLAMDCEPASLRTVKSLPLAN